MIPVSKPFFDRGDYAAMREPMDSGWVAQGPAVGRFEREFAGYAGAKHAVASTSCTTAMHLALAALGVGAGDEVIVPSFSFVATAAAVEYTGARPVFCDVMPDTFNIDISDMERKLTKRTRAVMPVHLFGLCADMKAVMKVARESGLMVVEDAACGAGSRIGKRNAGTFGDAGCFSFHPRKIITTGEGGMLVTGNKKVAEDAVRLRSHGAGTAAYNRHLKGGYVLPDFDVLGFNYRMTDIQAALGISQLAKIDRIIELRKKWADLYMKLLGGVDGVVLPVCPAGMTHAYQSFVVTLEKGLDRNAVGAEMERRGIATRQGSHAIHLLGWFRKKYKLKPGDFPVSRMLHERSMALPLFPGMTAGEVREVAGQLRDVVARLG